MRVRYRLSWTKWLPVQRRRRRSHDIGINFIVNLKSSRPYSENVYSKIMSQGQKRAQNSSVSAKNAFFLSKNDFWWRRRFLKVK